jgi:hypothetical protein
MGAASQCPLNVCSGFNNNGQFMQYSAFATGGNYYANWGPGSMYYSFAAVAIAAAEWGHQEVGNLPIEPIGNLYQDPNGIFTFSLTGFGDCDLGSGVCTGNVDPYATPESDSLVGFWHDHPFGYPASSADDRSTSDFWGIPMITGVGPYVLIYVPGSGCFNGDAVLSGGSLPGACSYNYTVP